MSNIITALIVDDEQDSRELLRSYVTKYCKDIKIIGESENIIKAQDQIKSLSPQLLFLDIEMPHGNAFDLLEQVDVVDFEVIFITAFSQYAIKAFNLSAAHYLLKPLSIEQLQDAVVTVRKNINQKNGYERMQALIHNTRQDNSQDRKLVLPLMEGFDVVKMSDILYCVAEDNFTVFYYNDGSNQMICRSLKFYDGVLSDYGFCRIHRSYMINLHYLKRYNKGKGGSVILENGKELSVATTRKSELMKCINEWVG